MSQDLTLAAGPGQAGRYYGWRIVAVLAVTETVSWGVLYYSFSVFMLPMQRELGLSSGAVSGAFSVALLVMGVTAVPVGRWVDRYGARGVMTAGSVAAAVFVAAWSQVQSAWHLYVVLAGVGAVAAMVLYEPAFAVVVRWFDEHRARALLAVTVVAGFASTIFVPTAAALEHALGWRDALLVLAGVLALLTVLPHAVVLRRDPADLGLEPDGRAVRHLSPPRPPVRTGLRDTARAAAGSARFRWLTLAFAANTVALIVVSVHLFPFLREHGHSVPFAAAATGALGLLSVSGRLVVTGLVSRLPMARVTALVFALQGFGTVVLLAAPFSAVGAVVFVVLFGLGFGVGTIARPALLAEGYGIANYATLSALLGLALTAAKVTAPVAAGASRTLTGSYTLVLAALVAACLVSAVALLAAERAEPSQAAAEPPADPPADPRS